MKVYASTNSYDMGKPNPFSPINTSNGDEQNESSSTNTTGTGSDSSQTGSQGKFLNTVGK